MNRSISQDEFLKLLDELNDERILNVVDFKKLLEFNYKDAIGIIKCLKLVNDDKALVFKLLIKCSNPSKIYNILEKYPVYRTCARLQFLIDNIDNPYLNSIAGLVKCDALFNDKELVNQIIKRTTSSPYFCFRLNGSIECLSLLVENEVENYEDGKRNIFLQNSFKLVDVKNMESFVNLGEIEVLVENYKFLDYILLYCNNKEEAHLNNLAFVLNKFDKLGWLDDVYEKLSIIDNNEEVEKVEEKRLVLDALCNISKIGGKRIEDENELGYLLSKIEASPSDFDIDLSFVNLLADKNSVVYDKNAYQILIVCDNLNVKKTILTALDTSLANFMSEDLIKLLVTHKDSDLEIVEATLKFLAQKYQCLDYFEKIKGKGFNKYFSDNFREYIDNYSLKDGLDSLKEKVENASFCLEDDKVVLDIDKKLVKA